jgi:hypothetical protein
MDLEDNSVQSESESLSGLLSESGPAEESPASPAEEAPTAPAQVVDPKAEELEFLKRVIASDPVKRQQYEASLYQKYGEPYVPPVPQQEEPKEDQPNPQTKPAFQPIQLPFEPDEYDATSFEHQVGLIGTVVQHVIPQVMSQVLQPFQVFIDEQRQYDQQQAQQQQQAEQYNRASAIANSIGEIVPGFKEITDLQSYNADQELFLKYAADRYLAAAQNYPQGLWMNAQVSKEIASQIAPELNRFGNALGVFQAQTATPVNNSQVKTRESYVEGANAVPVDNSNAFSKAYESGSISKMLSNLQ